jgi:hypothetical protein
MTDTCPNCVTRGIPPAASRRRGDQIAHGYRCPDCGHQWATARDLPSYSELHRPVSARPHRKAS